MGSEWTELPLEEAMEAIIDYRGKTPKKTDSGIPLITAKIVKNGRIQPTQEYIAEEDYDSWMQRGLPQKGDVVLTTEAPLGEVAQLDGSKVALAQRIITLRGKSGLLESDFLKYLLQSHAVQHQFDGRASGTTVSGIKQSELRQVLLSFPPLPEQKAIAHILGTLDDKIELNRRMNATLEGMAQALFKSWFVDFDPVIDNALAAGNPIPDELAPRAEVRKNALANGTTQQGSVDHPTLSDPKSLFPAAFQFTEELGWIPEGWKTQPLYDIADFVNGAAYKGADFSDAEDALPVIKIAEVKAGITGQTKFTTINKGDKYRVEDGDILLSWSGNPDTSIDTFIWTNGPGYLNQHIFNVRLHDESERHFVYYQLKYLRSTFAEIARDKQTTGLGHFTAGDMKRLMVFKPADTLLEQFNAAVSSIYSRDYENRLATKTLAKLRDTLLPKLISGELRISETEQLTKEALS